MKRMLLSLALVVAVDLQVFAQGEPNPPVIAVMEELGTVYVTRRPAGKAKKASPETKTKTVIIGVDFRPAKGSDPQKVAAAVKQLDTLPDLETILLLGRDVTDASAEALPAGPKITSIQFFNTQTTDKGIASLTKHKNLRVFNYTGMGLTDAGMKELAKIKTLQSIRITDAKVTDDGVLALQTLSGLRLLNVENTLATQKAIDRLREKLPRLSDFEPTLR